jgi:hypothetical protein
VEATGRRALLLEFRNDWYKMEGCFNNGHELSGTNVNRLWDSVSFVMQARAARAATWGCAEVLGACRAQYEALSPYRTAIATAVSRAASAFIACRNGPQREHGVPQYFRTLLVGACPPPRPSRGGRGYQGRQGAPGPPTPSGLPSAAPGVTTRATPGPTASAAPSCPAGGPAQSPRFCRQTDLGPYRGYRYRAPYPGRRHRLYVRGQRRFPWPLPPQLRVSPAPSLHFWQLPRMDRRRSPHSRLLERRRPHRRLPHRVADVRPDPPNG